MGSLRRIGQLVFSSRLLFVCGSVEGQKTATHLLDSLSDVVIWVLVTTVSQFLLLENCNC